MSLQFYQVKTDDDRSELLNFYHAEQQKINRHDLGLVYVLQQENNIVAALKVEAIKQPDSWFIRNVLVAEHARGEGLSKQLLKQALLDLTDKACFCLAYVHLQSLYSYSGFTIIDIASAADIFQKRFYRAQKKALVDPQKAVVLMAIDQRL